PQVLDVLRRRHVPATFFVVGSQVAAHPGLVRAELAQGHEIGAHTFTHKDLAAGRHVRATVELTLTQSALAGAAGINTHLPRLPYSSKADELTASQLQAARESARYGYVDVFATAD